MHPSTAIRVTTRESKRMINQQKRRVSNLEIHVVHSTSVDKSKTGTGQ